VPKENILVKNELFSRVKEENIDLQREEGNRKAIKQIEKVPSLADQSERKEHKAT